jgi:hypothetical protein
MYSTNAQYTLPDGRVGTFKNYKLVDNELLMLFVTGKDTIVVRKNEMKVISNK